MSVLTSISCAGVSPESLDGVAPMRCRLRTSIGTNLGLGEFGCSRLSMSVAEDMGLRDFDRAPFSCDWRALRFLRRGPCDDVPPS